MNRILLTGFEAFGDHPSNPTLTALSAFGNQQIAGAQVFTQALPVNAASMPEVLAQVLKRVQPHAVLLTGLAAGRVQLSLERVALNVLDFRIPDNAGASFQDRELCSGGPDAYLSTLPLRAILSAWREAGVPGYVSDTAGLYLCNQAMYLARHQLGPGVPCGFLHVPADETLALFQPPGRPLLPYLPQSEINRGIGLALDALAAGLTSL
ncbi:pyroglutamyl-peptidase I [Deinococcus rubellus]|uniref:Pyroglutamyl-peptidase I n=1 Tax=Deinococcus rubellus TaxID=1889240 RepID=A0ABY5YF63_9DEIO|nr:pyrrolidone-carboxylate peptidase [Deinococcus rubellus]UWX62811.1 pyrrolidone-carboxylate peptidase [Deinococcus rubellus]